MATPDRRLFVGRWWRTFRLVLLLAIGPALLGLAMATAYRPIMVWPKVTTLPDGSTERIAWNPWTGRTEVTTSPLSGQPIRVRIATDEEVAAVPILPRRSLASFLTTALLAVLTVLAHGAWVVSLGLALGIAFGKRGPRPAIAMSILVFLFVTIGWPILYSLYWYVPTHPQSHPPHQLGMLLASPVPALVVLLIDHPPREDMIGEFVWWATFWVLIFVLLAVAVATLTIAIVDRRSQAHPSSEREVGDEEPVIESVLVGD